MTTPGWLGSTLAMLRDPLGFTVRLNDGPPVTPLRLGPHRVYHLNDPALLHEVLVRQDRSFVKGKMVTRAAALLGEGLGMNIRTPHGVRLHEPRLAHRRMLQPAFGAAHLGTYHDVFLGAVDDALATWQDGATIDLCATGRAISFTAAVRGLLGQCGAGEREIADLVGYLLGGLVRHTSAPRWVEALPLRENRRYQASLARLNALLTDHAELVREHRATSSPLLATLLAARDEQDRPLSLRKVRAHLLSILFPGSPTVADTIPWMFHELLRSPQAAAGVVEEVDRVLAGRVPEPQDVKALKHCARVVHETLRLHAPQWMLSRRTIEPVLLGDTLLPTGATVAFSLYALHRDPRWYPSPLRFDPDRWLPDRAATLQRCAYLPFSTGVGKCIGDGFAMNVLVLTLAAVFSRWRISAVPGITPREVVGLTVRPDHVPVVCRRRRN